MTDNELMLIATLEDAILCIESLQNEFDPCNYNDEIQGYNIVIETIKRQHNE